MRVTSETCAFKCEYPDYIGSQNSSSEENSQTFIKKFIVFKNYKFKNSN